MNIIFLFLIRLISAICLYLFLAKANIYFTEFEQSIFVGGYRFLLVFAPLMAFFFPQKGVAVGFALAAASSLGFLIGSSVWLIVLLSLGLSSGGFLIKRQATETAKGAALNKMALSLGSIVSGLALMILPDNRSLFFVFMALLLGIASFGGILQSQEVSRIPFYNYERRFLPILTWVLCGISIGVRLFSLFVILPQYLINQLGELPLWYGWAVSLYSIAVMLSQLPALLNKQVRSFFWAASALFISCLLLTMPHIFAVETLPGCAIWCLLLVGEEVFAPYIDAEASQNNALLYKEIGVGIGGALSVWLMRSYHSPLWAGLLGACSIGLTFLLYRFKERAVDHLEKV